MYQKALEKVRAELEKANDEEKAKLEIQVKNLEENLRQAEENEKSRINGSENKSWICLCNIKYRFIW